MIVHQGYVAKSLSDIPFLRDNGLTKYMNNKAPVVVFGGHYPDTIDVIKKHRGAVIIHWTGADSKRCKDIAFYTRSNIINVTPLPNVKKLLDKKGVSCYLIRFAIHKRPEPLVRGNKIYTYIHHLDEQKYNADIVRAVKTSYEIMILRLDISKQDWHEGRCDEFYGQSFIGLALSSFTGAAGSAWEMGLRGIRVVTNVIDMPHCIPWSTVEDIEDAIKKESRHIGIMDKKLSDHVANEMIIGAKEFDLKKIKI